MAKVTVSSNLTHPANFPVSRISANLLLMKTKVCTGCKRRKSLDRFDQLKKGKFGRHPKCKTCRAIYMHAHYLRVGATPYTTDSWRLHKHGLTKKQFEDIKRKQGHRCKICRKRKSLVVDHCHKIKKIRGLLCTGCNTGLGKLGDTIKGLERALNYLKGL